MTEMSVCYLFHGVKKDGDFRQQKEILNSPFSHCQNPTSALNIDHLVFMVHL
jgi:hypothetical protein